MINDIFKQAKNRGEFELVNFEFGELDYVIAFSEITFYNSPKKYILVDLLLVAPELSHTSVVRRCFFPLKYRTL